MAFELQMLVLMSFLFALAWLPASVARCRTYGLEWLISDRSSEDLPALPGWGQRAELAHADLTQAFPAFAVALILLAITGGYSEGTRLATALFVLARLTHFGSSLAGLAWSLRFSWAMGLLATLYLLWVAMAGMVVF